MEPMGALPPARRHTTLYPTMGAWHATAKRQGGETNSKVNTADDTRTQTQTQTQGHRGTGTDTTHHTVVRAHGFIPLQLQPPRKPAAEPRGGWCGVGLVLRLDGCRRWRHGRLSHHVERLHSKNVRGRVLQPRHGVLQGTGFHLQAAVVVFHLQVVRHCRRTVRFALFGAFCVAVVG